MRNVDLITEKIEKIEGKLKTLIMMTTRPNFTTKDFQTTINEVENMLSQIKSMVQRRD